MLTCDMDRNCKEPVTHIDVKGYAYCQKHGEDRKQTCRCRKLTPAELNTLKAGQPLKEY